MIVLLPTIKHTGSHFVLKKLLNGWTRIDLKNAEKRFELIRNWENGVVFDHVFPNKYQMWERLIYRYPSIVPLRKKEDVWESWKKRSNEPDRKLFDYMFWYVDNILKYTGKTFYINIDDPDKRQDQLDSIHACLGVELDPGDWPVIRRTDAG